VIGRVCRFSNNANGSEACACGLPARISLITSELDASAASKFAAACLYAPAPASAIGRDENSEIEPLLRSRRTGGFARLLSAQWLTRAEHAPSCHVRHPAGIARPLPAAAQQSPSTRVGRVSAVEGKLAFYQAGDPDWPEAEINYPVPSGGWFATAPQSEAELRIGPDSVSLANDTQLDFVELSPKTMQIELTQGRVGLHTRRPDHDETVEIDTPRGGVWLLRAGVYDIDAGNADNHTRITVFQGSARFVGGGIDRTVNAGEALLLSGADNALSCAPIRRGLVPPRAAGRLSALPRWSLGVDRAVGLDLGRR
jgi:hypothetical protein